MEIAKEAGCKNLKLRNGDFCMMWRCRNLDKDYPCISCPVVHDLSIMADALHIRVDLCEDIAVKAA
ncbi:MAG TPA: hypothetical protein VHP36_10530 [Chitinispirillaceae bacterium]|nr:hypothetical protein [Chitinispirillaceae bacterium]